MIGLATVGTSQIAAQFLAACRLSGRYRLQVATSRHADTAARFAQEQGFASWDTDLLRVAQNPAVDAVYIASPNALHYDQSRLFLAHGKHVLCEKPAVTQAAQYAELQARAKAQGVVYLEAMMSRHCAGRAVLREALGRIGRISQARLDFSQRSSRYDRFMAGEHVNIFDMSLGAGALMDLGVYCVYTALDLFGTPREVYATATLLPNGADGAGNALLHYDGFTASLSYSKIGQGAVGSEIVGDNGTLKIGLISQYTHLSLVQGGQEICLLAEPSRTEVMRGETDAFADFVRAPQETADHYHAASALAQEVHRCMDQIKTSAGLIYPPYRP